MTNQPASTANLPSPQHRPFSVWVVTVLLLLEGLAVLGYALSYALQLGAAGALGMGARIFMLVLIVIAGTWQLLVAHHFFRGRAWTRAAVLFWQVFQIILAIPYFQSGDALMAWAWLVPAAAITVLLFDPRVTAFLGDRPGTQSPAAN
ncbi:hypothetical protein [Paeniglutamicibacter sp. Y32M11]|uniref:hypothetical protein n=1 Tax=Paeniglutamicibacter sp. Y32M11 TaxID=2853258 RepID=UPI001C53203E|nr:hypothetical protein [Paeniglutamicibacter sp. Y32M11]QXQ11475.1 hypothetical protein KUF55_06205 [Paeniglutamicibacter sp. Y32M11]